MDFGSGQCAEADVAALEKVFRRRFPEVFGRLTLAPEHEARKSLRDEEGWRAWESQWEKEQVGVRRAEAIRRAKEKIERRARQQEEAKRAAEEQRSAERRARQEAAAEARRSQK